MEAASATARALALEVPEAVLHVGVAGGRRLEVGCCVVGTESVYADISAAFRSSPRSSPTPLCSRPRARRFPRRSRCPSARARQSAGSPAWRRTASRSRRWKVSACCGLRPGRGPRGRGQSRLERDRRSGSRALGRRRCARDPRCHPPRAARDTFAGARVSSVRRMARDTKARSRELPPPLPPERRTVGQLVAETIRLYGGQLLEGARARRARRPRQCSRVDGHEVVRARSSTGAWPSRSPPRC